jgi:hypothetical protein
MRSYVLATFMLAASLMTGCAATVTADAYPPDMVYVSPGVQVIADYDEPIFFTDGFYWRFYGGTWYRSTYYTGGWVYARPPVAVMRIDRPYAYAHYRPVGYVARNPASQPSGWRGNPPPANSGWRGAPATQPPAGGGWRGGPQPAPAGRAPVAGGWRGGPAPAPQARPAPPPQSHPAPAPARPAPRGHGGGWRH